MVHATGRDRAYGLEPGFSLALFNFSWAPAGAIGAIAGDGSRTPRRVAIAY